MSRTFRRGRRTNIKNQRDGSIWKCKCEWCINIPYRDRYGLTIKEELSL